MTKIMVYPTAQNSLVIRHPIDGQLKAEGSKWEQDGFTARMLTDGAVTSSHNLAWESAEPPADPSAPPAHKTAD